MKKEGFTLIELLAVIALSAIIVSLVTLSVVKAINKARESAFRTEVINVYKLAKNQREINMYDRGFDNLYDGFDNKLMLSTKDNFDYRVKFDESGETEYLCVYDGKYKIELKNVTDTSLIEEAQINKEASSCTTVENFEDPRIIVINGDENKCVSIKIININLGNMSNYFIYKYRINDGDYIDIPNSSSPVSFNINKSSKIEVSIFDGKEIVKSVEKSVAFVGNEYAVTYHKNNAGSIDKTSDKCCGENGSSCEVVAPNIISQNGYTVVGWNRNKDATTAQYEVGSNIALTSNIDLYAVTTKTYTATFVKNGATSIGSISLSCTTLGTSCTVTSPTITRSGYTVVGWNSNKNATTAQYKVGSNITLTSNITLYAITKATTYTCRSAAYLTSSGYNDSLVKFTCPDGQYFDSSQGGCWIQAGVGTDTKYGTQYEKTMFCSESGLFCASRINCTGGGTVAKCVKIEVRDGGLWCKVTYRETCSKESSEGACPTGYGRYGDRCGSWDTSVLECREGFESGGYCYKFGQSTCPSGWTKIEE